MTRANLSVVGLLSITLFFFFLLLQWRRLHLRKVDVFQAWFKVAVSVIDLGCPEVQLVLISWIGISRYANIYIFFYR